MIVAFYFFMRVSIMTA